MKTDEHGRGRDSFLSPEIENREAALCLFIRGGALLVAEIQDPHTGLILHRPPGGGLEEGEHPEQALRREVREELGITVDGVTPLGSVEHVWFWKGREVRERAWLFVAESDDARLSCDGAPELVEADGQRIRTLWRPIAEKGESLPPLCPPGISELLE